MTRLSDFNNNKTVSTAHTTVINTRNYGKRNRQDTYGSFINDKYYEDKDKLLEVYESFYNEVLTP
jgi:hypothetical protein